MSEEALSSVGATRLLSSDDYLWKARKLPVLYVVLPAAFAAGAWLPNLSWWQMVPAGVLCLLIGLCGDMGRIGGKAQEEKLFARWGAKPTTRMLRHRATPFAAQKLKLLHQKFTSLTGVKAPTKNQEEKDPDEADKIYESYVSYLRQEARKTERLPLVRTELINYGFARNCWGLRWWGRAISALGVLLILARLAWLWHSQVMLLNGGITFVLALFTLFLLGFWTFCVRENWVRNVAEAYASRLLESVSTLPDASE